MYLEFTTDDGDTVLVEVEEGTDSTSASGVVKVGATEAVERKVMAAKSKFENAIRGTIKHNVEAFIDSICELSHLPDEVEITFGLKATAEAGNVAVGKVGGQLNYNVKLSWQNLSQKSLK
ncbi:MAG: CU044_2847 family protein [Bacteroidota bacterium]